MNEENVFGTLMSHGKLLKDISVLSVLKPSNASIFYFSLSLIKISAKKTGLGTDLY